MSTTELSSTYDPKSAEEHWYKEWEARGDFTPDPDSDAPMYSIVIPPPNVTGYLHMGHALQHTLMDVLTRRKRMQGFKTLWLPGTDHAGISTQVVVERQLQAEGITRQEIGREEFEQRVWKWRAHSGGRIQRQIRREGASVDWTRERFTLDEGLSQAVREVFVSLFDEGLIYRGARMVNWCVEHGALSDLEAPKEDVLGTLTEIRYPVKDSPDEFVTVATTRPETMLGDTGVAVHPEDERYAHLVGKTVILPLMNREIPVVADEAVEKEFGTGAVKVTPAHDPADFEIGRRHNLPQVVVIGLDGTMTAEAGRFAGLERFEARKQVVAALEELGLLGERKDYPHKVPQCDRCRRIIEPLVSEQWFCDVKDMANAALEAVRDGRTRFTPERWTKVYTDWMENIQPWCISRQLWWGHRIPAWYCPDGHTTVSREDPTACARCGSGELRQDPDVLDTWFSSALWPFSTLGWPDRTQDLEVYYPTSVLVTGFDIIFFWVARMMMMGLKFMGDVPFRDVLITGLILDSKGEKMSKMKNNVVDPIDVFDKFSVDATRFTLAAAAQAGTDIKWRDDRVEEYRNFTNKIWQASRFVLMNFGDTGRCEWVDTPESPASLSEKWILSRLNRTALSVNKAIDEYRFHEAASELYHFFWDEFCSWFIELSKPAVASQNTDAAAAAARSRIAFVLETSLRLLHPFMPYITEEIWQRLPHDGPTIGLATYPAGDESSADAGVESEMGYVLDLITRVRNIRSEMNVPSKPLRLYVSTTDARIAERVRGNAADIVRLGRLESLHVVDAVPALGLAARAVLPGAELAVPLEGLIDVEVERKRLSKELEKARNERIPLSKKLENPNFVDRAAPDVVEATRARVAELDAGIARLEVLVASMN
jgi:valyl-tRNA synthetase